MLDLLGRRPGKPVLPVMTALLLLAVLSVPPKIQECRAKPTVPVCISCCLEAAPKEFSERTRAKLCEKVCREPKLVSPSTP